MPKRPPATIPDAEVIALNALGFLAREPKRLERFLALSGSTPAMIRRQAGDPLFLAGVLDHLLADQTLLLLFAETEGISPEVVVQGRRRLPGSDC